MKKEPVPTCAKHKTSRNWQVTTFDYREDDISIRVPNLRAWVCPVDGEASFKPETVDELLATVRELLATAKRARKRRSELTEYIVSVG